MCEPKAMFKQDEPQQKSFILKRGLRLNESRISGKSQHFHLDDN